MNSPERRDGIPTSGLGLPQQRPDQFRPKEQIEQSAHDRIEIIPLEDPLREVPAIPLTQLDFQRKLGWGVIWLVAIGVGFVVTKELPTLPQWIFYPIVLVVLVLEIILKQWLFGMSLRLDSRMLAYGPLWARKKYAFSEIKAIQLLQVSKIAKKNKKDDRLFEINIVIRGNRVHFASNANKEKATNVANTLCDVIKVPLIEQLCV